MYSLIVALALMTATSATAAEVTATRLDGTTVAGELQSWDGQAAVIAKNDGAVRLATDELLSFRWSPALAAAAKSSLQPVVELVDGTILPIEDFRRQGRAATVMLRGAMATDIKSLNVSDRLVVAVRLQPLQGAVARQWEEIQAQEFPSDVLAVLKRDGQSLDYVEGSIGDITADRIEFKIDDQTKRVDRAKVAGVIFYRVIRSPDAEPLCVIHGRDGLRAKVAKISLHDGLLRMTTIGGAKFSWPLDDVRFADFSAGKVVFLSDLEPASEQRTPLVGLPAGALLAANYGRPRRDQSPYGGPLTLWFPGGDSLASAGHTQTFGKGLALRSRTEQVYRLPSGFKRLVGIVGIEPTTRGDGSTRLVITADDRPLVDAEIAGNQSPLPIELDIAGVKRLKIVVDYGQNLDTGDWLNLCDVRIVK